ncbi:MAG: TlpA disulfide reductase family protein [Granulosicoccus sp.]
MQRTNIDHNDAGAAEKSPDTRRRRILQFGSITALGAAGLVRAPAVNAQNLTQYGITGQAAPELAVSGWTDAKGAATKFSIADSRGKWVFLKCWQAWCPGCHSSGFPTLQAVQKAFHGHPDVAIAAVQTVFEGFGSNTQDKVAEMRDRYELVIPMGHDAGDADGDKRPSTMVSYRTGGTPWLILIDPGGKVVFNDFQVQTDKLIDYINEKVA